MTNRQIESLLKRMCDTIPDMLERELGPGRNVCILATRIAIYVLQDLRVPARAQPVQLLVFNGPATDKARETGVFQPETQEERREWVRDGARTVVLGFGHPDTVAALRRPENRRRGYDGHMVAIVRERYLLDLTLDQAHRPDKGIYIEPVYFAVSTEWLRATPPSSRLMLDPEAMFSMTGEHDSGHRVSLHYQRIEDATFRASRDWNIPRHHPLVRKAKEVARAR